MKVLYALSFFVPVIRRIPCAFFVWKTALLCLFILPLFLS